jgi:hypothetical protein
MQQLSLCDQRKLGLTSRAEVAKCHATLEALKTLPDDWDTYDAVHPSANAIETARSLLDSLDSCGLLPDRIAASADGGVALTITRGQRYAVIECTNDGEVVAATSNGYGAVDSWEVPGEIGADESEVQATLHRIGAFLDG